MARKSGAVCPPGIFCLTPGVILFLAFLIVGLIGGLAYMKMIEATPAAVSNIDPTKRFFNDPSQFQRPPAVYVNARGGDDRYTRAPEPLRGWFGGPALSSPPIGGNPIIGGAMVMPPPFGYATQGPAENYQSYGFIMTKSGQTLPLYGRRTLTGSDRYNYYTRTDTYNPIPIPIRYKGRDCQDQVGCDEIFNGEKVRMVNGDEGKVSVYQFDGPAYNPYTV